MEQKTNIRVSVNLAQELEKMAGRFTVQERVKTKSEVRITDMDAGMYEVLTSNPPEQVIDRPITTGELVEYLMVKYTKSINL